MCRAAIRLSYSQILRLRRCPWAWHARHVRSLVPLRRKRPPPVWGDAYHAAAAAVWTSRAHLEASFPEATIECRAEQVMNEARQAALTRLQELDVPGLDNDALATEVAQAAVEVCRFVGPEWRVLWLDGEPVVERRLVTQIGESTAVRVCATCQGDERDCGCKSAHCYNGVEWLETPVELVTVLDLALVHEDGRVRVVDHKTTTSWPEQVGDVLRADEDLDLDLRDDLQIRLYVLALWHALAEEAKRRGGDESAYWSAGDITSVEGYHLVRRATVGHEPPRTRNGHGPLSRAAEYEATVEQWMTALRRHHLRPEDYEQQIAQARLRRWQAWAPSEFTPQSLELARHEALQAAEEIARLEPLQADDVPRFRKPGRWMQFRPGHGSGAQPKTSAEVFHWDSCAACDWRELCVAEGQGDKSAADLVLAGEFAHVDEARAERAAREVPACELDADEVE